MNEHLMLVKDDAFAAALRLHLAGAGAGAGDRLHREADGRHAMAA